MLTSIVTLSPENNEGVSRFSSPELVVNYSDNCLLSGSETVNFSGVSLFYEHMETIRAFQNTLLDTDAELTRFTMTGFESAVSDDEWCEWSNP
jgi:hypothetical protein